MQNRYSHATVTLVALAFATKVLGFISDQLVASFFGASAVTDAYVLVVTLSVLVYNLFGADAASAVVPMLTAALQEGGMQHLSRTSSRLLTLTTSGSVVLVAVILALLNPIVRLITSGAPEVTVALTYQLSRIVIPSVLFLILGAYLASVLSALKHFTAPAICPLLTNVLIIAATLWIAPATGIAALTFATCVGMVLTSAINWWVIKKRGVRLRLAKPGDSGLVRKVATLVWPTTLANGVLQLAVTVDRAIAASMPAGTISALNYATKLMQLPYGLITAAAPVMLSSLSEASARTDGSEFQRRFGVSFLLVSIATVPIAAMLMAMAHPIVAVAFERGAFTANDTLRTVAALRWYAVAVVVHVPNFILLRALYALERTSDTLVAVLAGVSANIIGSLVLSRLYGHVGISMAYVLHGLATQLVLLYFLQRRAPQLPLSTIYGCFASAILGGIGAGYIMQVMSAAMAAPSLTGEIVNLCVSAAVGLTIYGSWLLISGTHRKYRAFATGSFCQRPSDERGK